MGEIIFGGLVALFVGYIASRLDMQEWKAAAELCGLQDVKVSRLVPMLTARAGPVEVRIRVSGDKKLSTLIVVTVPGPPGFDEVSIRPEQNLWRDVETGDPRFDGTFLIQGPMPLVSALLDKETRRLLSDVQFGCRLRLSSGKLQAHLVNEKIFDVLPGLVKTGQLFARPLDIPRRLAGNAREDDEPGVRLQNMLLLVRDLPVHPVTAEVLREAISDPDPEVRGRAARVLGAEGRGVLLEVAENQEDDDASAEAVAALDRDLPFERAKAILDRALSRRRLRTARACLQSIGRSGAAGAVDVLAQVAQDDDELAVDAVRALGETGSPAAEPPLIQALQREQENLRVAAMNALGRVGSAAAVLPLKEVAEGSWLDLGFRRAARQAIAEIQSRVEGASPGQLSLAAAEAGQLSLAQAEAGQLSLAPDPAGQLSLSGDESPDAGGGESC